ncbi:MAG: ABC transporter permease, partial [Lachnospiraceae bacterium]|nr:ABC transporter permease [Lachnospiraceae bacterium]
SFRIWGGKMYRYFFIAKNNMKKQKADMITFFTMTFLSAFMLFICLNLVVGTFSVLDKNDEQIKGADILILTSDDPVTNFKFEEIIRGNDHYQDFDSDKYLSALVNYRKKGAKKWAEYSYHFASYEDERTIHTASIDMSGFSDNDIVIPVSMSTSYSIGDTIEIKISENIYEFRVAGFNEDFIYSSPMNMGTYLAFISERYYQTLLFENTGFIEQDMNIRVNLSQKGIDSGLNPTSAADEVYNEIDKWMESYSKTHPDFKGISANFIPADMMKTATMILPFLVIAIITVFALLLLLISLVVIDFSVKNFIMDNMRNTGIMEAAGYTVNEMIFILLIQLLSVSFMGSLTGLILGALLQKKIGIIMLFLLGLSWNQGANIALLIAVLLSICMIIGIFTVVLGREYRKTTVLEALRGGINAHNFKKNIFPFDKTALPVPLTLALKETFGKFRGQIGVIIIMGVLAFSSAMGFGIYESMGKDVDTLLRISGIDISDASFTADDANMISAVENLESVDKITTEVWLGMEFTNGKTKKNYTTRVISDTSVMKEELMVEGRWPKHENEVAFGTMAMDSLGLKVGDTVKAKSGEEEATYIVTGMMQTFNNMGQMAYMSEAGYLRIGREVSTKSCNVYIKKGYTFEDLEKEFNDIYPDKEIVDVLASTGGLFTLLQTTFRLVVVLILIVTAFVVGLAESLLIKTRISKEWRNLGVSKALGYSSNQLILQLILSNIPSVLIGIVLGVTAAVLFGDKVVLLMFAIFGFRKVVFEISGLSIVCVIYVIVVMAAVVSWINGNRIKKLDPVKMITEE